MKNIDTTSPKGKIFAEIWRNGPLSRRDLLESTGFTKSAIFQLTEALERDGLITRSGLRSSGSQGGRRAALLEADPQAFCVAGAHIGVTRTSVALADTFGRVLDLSSWPTYRRDPHKTFTRIAQEISRLSDQHAAPAAIGVAVPGLMERDTGNCLNAPNLGWRDVPVSATIQRETGVPTIALNTVQAMAVAESSYTVPRRSSTMALLYVGTGVGSAVTINGRLFRGNDGVAGEIGHLQVRDPTKSDAPRCSCGRFGCLESLVGAAALVSRAKGMGLADPGTRLTAALVSKMAQNGNPTARRLINDVAEELGEAAASIVQLFNPGTLVLAGALASMGDLLLTPLREAIIQRTQVEVHQDLEIRRSLLDNQGKLQGAILLGLEALGVPVPGFRS